MYSLISEAGEGGRGIYIYRGGGRLYGNRRLLSDTIWRSTKQC